MNTPRAASRPLGVPDPRPGHGRFAHRAGHGAGKPTTKIIEEQADRWAFLVRALGLNDLRIKG